MASCAGCASLEGLTKDSTGFYSLTRIGGVFHVKNNKDLRSVAIPKLSVVDSDFVVSGNGLLESINLGLLREVRSRFHISNEGFLGTQLPCPTKVAAIDACAFTAAQADDVVDEIGGLDCCFCCCCCCCRWECEGPGAHPRQLGESRWFVSG